MKATAAGAQDGCPFCQLVMSRVETGEGIQQLGASGVYQFEPLNPVTPGHRLFVPASHYESAAEAPSATGVVFQWAAWWAAEQGEDFNLIVNAGPNASQTVNHLHVHYVPRREGDGLVLPLTGQNVEREPGPEVYERADGLFAWRLRAANGRIIATDGGQGFERHGTAKASALAVVSGRYAQQG